MFRRLTRFVFLSLTFLCGVIAGGINTPTLIAYAQTMGTEVEEQTEPVKTKTIKKQKRLIKTSV